jgi:hypothetical protein
MFTEQWMLDEIMSRGAEVFNYYIRQYESMPSCKPEIYKTGEQYDNCMVEKCNHCYENTRAYFMKK